MNFNFYKKGFTLVEVLVVVAVIAILSAVVLASLNNARTKGENAATVQQVEEYITALELTYNANNRSYPYNGASNLTTYGCLVNTRGTPQGCMFNGAWIAMYPNAAGLAILGQQIKLARLNTQIRDGQNHLFDSITYSTNGTVFRLRYPMKGVFTANSQCGVENATILNAGGAQYPGVTICLYQSR